MSANTELVLEVQAPLMLGGEKQKLFTEGLAFDLNVFFFLSILSSVLAIVANQSVEEQEANF